MKVLTHYVHAWFNMRWAKMHMVYGSDYHWNELDIDAAYRAGFAKCKEEALKLLSGGYDSKGWYVREDDLTKLGEEELNND